MARATSERSGGLVEALGSNILVQFLSLLHHGTMKSSQYHFHLSAICAASVKFSLVADWRHCRCGWNFRVNDYLKRAAWNFLLSSLLPIPAAAAYPFYSELSLYLEPSVFDIGSCLCLLFPV